MKPSILVEIGIPSLQVENFDTGWNFTNLDLLEEKREQAHLRMIVHKQWVELYFSKKVKELLEIGDLVLKKENSAGSTIIFPKGLQIKWQIKSS